MIFFRWLNAGRIALNSKLANGKLSNITGNTPDMPSAKASMRNNTTFQVEKRKPKNNIAKINNIIVAEKDPVLPNGVKTEIRENNISMILPNIVEKNNNSNPVQNDLLAQLSKHVLGLEEKQEIVKNGKRKNI